MTDDETSEVMGMLEKSAGGLGPQKPNHAMRVTSYSAAICRAMGISKEDIDPIARGAYLHDLGKMAIPAEILLKPGPLTLDETAIMREHCLRGYTMLKKLPNLTSAAEVVYSHHENYDGTGYPRGLKAAEIPFGARVVVIANTFDSITTNLPYRAARSREAARAEIQRCSGRQFDPEVVRVFLNMPDAIWPELAQIVC
jgi:putative nucleotidyltransferase with HDIG domain